jgi:DNA polymerase I-like protein with 3'-5' exonuclease and polymerase domains
MPWTGDAGADKRLAEQPGQRHLSFRDLAKRVAHGSNYDGSAAGIAAMVGIPKDFVETAQLNYFRSFPQIRAHNEGIKRLIMSTGKLPTTLGTERHFFGRLNDEHVHKQAIAFEPQFTIATLTNRGILDAMQRFNYFTEVHPLIQVHDGVLFQVRDDLLDTFCVWAKSHFLRPVHFPSGTMHIPIEIKAGRNWAKASKTNPEGLKKYVPQNPKLD